MNVKGNSGAIVSVDKMFGMSIDSDGHLILTMSDDEINKFNINEDGHLILSL